MRAAAHRFGQADAGDQHHADADRHVHVGAALAQRGPGGAEERAASIGDGRHRHQGGHPVEQRPRRRPHVLQQPGPDGHREHHHVAGGEAGDRQRAQQFPPGAVLRRGEAGGVERHQPVAQPRHQGDQAIALLRRPPPAQAQAAGGHVDPALHHRRVAAQHGFDQPDAGAALQPVHRQGQRVDAGGVGGDVAGEVVPLHRLLRPGRAQAGVQHALLIVAAEAQPLDGGAGGGAAGAAEAVAGRSRGAAMGADGVGRRVRGGGRDRLRRRAAHRTTIRRVARNSWPLAVTASSRSHWPASGNSALAT